MLVAHPVDFLVRFMSNARGQAAVFPSYPGRKTNCSAEDAIH